MEWYSWVLAVIGVSGIYFVGRKKKWAWLWLIFNECVCGSFLQLPLNSTVLYLLLLHTLQFTLNHFYVGLKKQ
jgi:hypothetical protein